MPTYLTATRDYYMEDMIFLLEPQKLTAELVNINR